MKKILVLLLVIFSVSLVNIADAGWPFNKTPPIEGVVTDTTTGKPIENVVVSCGWVREVDTPGGTVGKTFAWECSVTDKQGKYYLHGKTSFHIFSKFRYLDIKIFHPLYASKIGFGDNTGVSIDQKPVDKSADGIVHYNVELLSLDEKYVKEVESIKLKMEKGEITEDEWKKEMSRLAGNLNSEFSAYSNAAYWLNLRDNNIAFDLEETFKEWERLSIYFLNFPYSGYFDSYLPWCKKKIIENLQKVDKKK